MREEHIPLESRYCLSLILFDLMTRSPHTIGEGGE